MIYWVFCAMHDIRFLLFSCVLRVARLARSKLEDSALECVI